MLLFKLNDFEKQLYKNIEKQVSLDEYIEYCTQLKRSVFNDVDILDDNSFSEAYGYYLDCLLSYVFDTKREHEPASLQYEKDYEDFMQHEIASSVG